MRSILASLTLIVVVAFDVYAQSMPAPTYSVGDTWTVKTGNDTREIKVVKVNDGGTIDMLGYYSSCPTCIIQLDKNLTVLAVLDGSQKPMDVTRLPFVPIGGSWLLWSFPLEPKKRWDLQADGFLRGRSETYDVSNRVDGLEDVKTLGGTFKAYRIVRDWVLKGGRAQVRQQDFRWQTTTWFAPDVKFPVKSTTTNPRGENSELVSYSLK